MIQAPQIEPVSNLIRDYRTLFAKLKLGPIFLAQRSKPAAVLVSVEQWRQIARRLAEAEGALEAKRVLAAIQGGSMGTIRHDELVKLIAEKHTDAPVGD